MPISGRMGASFSQWQSQLGLTSCTREMWKQGRPAHTACGVLGHLAVQHLIGAVALGIDGVKVAGTDAAAAALALVVVDDGLVVSS